MASAATRAPPSPPHTVRFPMAYEFRDYWFWVVLRPSGEIEGEWLAHCLQLDLVTQGTSPQHAIQMAREAIELVVLDDLNHDLDPLDRPQADAACWDEYDDVTRNGLPLVCDLESFAKDKGAGIDEWIFVAGMAVRARKETAEEDVKVLLTRRPARSVAGY